MFGKFFASAFTGSMVGSGADVFAVWGYVISHTGPDALVELNPTLISVQIGMPVENVVAAIDFLCQPDPKSRSKNKKGRRLLKLGEFLYEVPNYLHYRSIKDNVARREANKKYQRNSRAKRVSQHVSKQATMSAQAEVEAYTEAEAEAEIPPSLNRSAWQDYVEHRKALRAKKLTPKGERMAMKKLADLPHDEQQKVVDLTISNGWQGLFPEKRNDKRGKRSFEETHAEVKRRAGLS